MKRFSPAWMLFAAITLALAACHEPPAETTPLIEPPKRPIQTPPTTRRKEPDFPTPIKLEKPKVLGPVLPAVVAIPQDLAEPSIRVKLTDESDAPPAIARSKYRGRVETIRLSTGKYVAINTLPMDAYLQGVLAKELYASWEPEAFRAQAIAARTYALYQLLTANKQSLWDVETDVRSQVYAGIAGETAKAREAVAATRGHVLFTNHNNVTGVFCTFFSACTGGATQDPNDAWGDPSIAPLAARRVGNVDANCPRVTWDPITIAKSDITRCVRSWGERNGVTATSSLGNVATVQITKRNASTNRPSELTLTDTAGKTAIIRAEEFRLSLLNDPLGRAPKPLSSWFDIRDNGSSITLVNGRGHGHGIGMSQWGAQNMALNGRSHTQILAFFYPNSTIRDLW